jgi:beta-N-acetylhexosaminidase
VWSPEASEEDSVPATSRRARIVLTIGVVLVVVGLFALVVPGLVAALTDARRPPSSTSSAPEAVPTTQSATPPSSPATTATPSPSASATSGPAPDEAQQVLAALSLEQRVGQVMMVSSPVSGPGATTLGALRVDRIGNVFLKGRTTAGAAVVGDVVKGLRAEATQPGPVKVAPFVATDQEGGQVQILRGPGFSDIPPALEQGAMDPAALHAAAASWGRQLAGVGVNVNFAPVMDTVPSPEFAPQNIPIGKYQREYGFNPDSVSAHGLAFAAGMADAGVAPVPKHFPGLGRVTANTDTSANVTDTVTSRTDSYLAPFADALHHGAGWVMLSNAFYPAIDPDHYAVFSPSVVGMLRGGYGFGGIIVSDDVCDAVQLSGFSVEARGADFLAAGGTMVLCTNETLASRVWQGIVDRARNDAAFAKAVDSAALGVLEAKARVGLLVP